MNSTDQLPVPVLGVFAYLDVVLPEEVRDTFSKQDFNQDDEDFHQWNSATRQVDEWIKDEFRLMQWGSPLRKALDAFRLYRKDDMAYAPTCAYNLHRRGGNPMEAMTADYSLRYFGVLSWMSQEEVKQVGPDQWLWNQFGLLTREGDRYVHYSQRASAGTLLVRGNRLVWKVEELRACITGVSLRWKAEYAKFQELGGNRAFLAGEFDWPPAGWINPVTNEEEAAALGKGRGLVMGDEI